MLLVEVALSIWGDMGELLAVVVMVIYFYVVAGSAGVVNFAEVSYFYPNLEFFS